MDERQTHVESCAYCAKDTDLWCTAQSPPFGRHTLTCTREKGHRGPHVACSSAEHGAGCWDDWGRFLCLSRIGDQIAYVPMHAEGDLHHPDTEYGFVTSVKVDNALAFCRYWHKGNPGKLRTTLNSEATSLDHLVTVDSVDNHCIERAITMYQIRTGERA